MRPTQIKFNFYLGDLDIFLLSLGLLAVGAIAGVTIYQLAKLYRGE